jgi:glutamate-5-semialdehyde dehydrogenase
VGMPEDGLVALVDDGDRCALGAMLEMRGVLDLLVPRGGHALIQRVVRGAKVPVLETGEGNCHVYVHSAADLAMACRIILNAKVQNPAVCNAAETLLVDRAVAERFLPMAGAALAEAGVTLRACPEAAALLSAAGVDAQLATAADWSTEYLSLTLAVRVVDGLDAAVAHIGRYGTGHSEAIVTDSQSAAEQFTRRVDAAAVYVNASTRFTDGGEFGLGAEIGISTQKLHARGPVGLADLTTVKHVVTGSGQVRT